MSSTTDRDASRQTARAAIALAGLVALAGVAATVGATGPPGPAADAALAAESDARSAAADVDVIERTVTDGEVAPGGVSTVEVFVDTEGQLGTHELVWLTDEFSPGFGAVQLRDSDPGVGGAGPNAASDGFQAVWNEDADNYTVAYDVAVPLDASPGDTYGIDGEIAVGGENQSIAGETITVDDGAPADTTVRLRPGAGAAEPGTETTYEVLVTGADEGVGSYALNVSTSNASVGSIAGVDLAADTGADDSAVGGDGAWAAIEADLGSEGHDAAAGVAIAELTVEADQAGSTRLSFADGAAVGNASGAPYDVSSTWSASLAVTDSPDATPGGGSEGDASEDGSGDSGADGSDDTDDDSGDDDSGDGDSGADDSDGSDDSEDSGDGSGDSDDTGAEDSETATEAGDGTTMDGDGDDSAEPGEDATDGNGPGFGIAAAVLGVVATALSIRRRTETGG